MLSFLIVSRNSPDALADCIEGVARSLFELQASADAVEFVFVDDASDAALGIVPMLENFRRQVQALVRIFRFRAHEHYTHALAYGLSATTGERVLFLSHDMILTPACLRALHAVAGLDRRHGIVRPISEHLDCLRQLELRPASPVHGYDAARQFSEEVARQRGAACVTSTVLIGDAMLVAREVLGTVGVFDTRFRGFLGDVDFGVRAQRAGFSLIVALGAWLHHEGGAAVKQAAAATGLSMQEATKRGQGDMVEPVRQFREKWGPLVPANFPTPWDGIEKLLTLPPRPFDFEPPRQDFEAIGDWV
jgi:hypothetical protein